MQDLYQLIHGLSANEKKYFKRFGIRDDTKGRSLTLKLFELLEEFDEYDEDKILYAARRGKMDKQLPSLKHYLKELVLDSLVWYHRENTPGLNTAISLSKIKLLEDRGMDEDALRLLEKISSGIKDEDAFVEKWNVLNRQIVTASNDFLSSKKYKWSNVEDVLHQREVLLHQMMQSHKYEVLLTRQLRVMRKSMQARTEDDAHELNSVFNDALINDESNADSIDSKYLRHTIRIHHYYLSGDIENFFVEALSMIDFVKNGKDFANQIMRKLWAYSQITQACYFTQRWKELENYLAELNALEPVTQTERMAQFSYYTQLAITLFDFQQKRRELLALLKETQRKLETFGAGLRPDIRLAITITAVSAFVEYGYYSDAITISENFLTNYGSGIRLDALLMLYVYELIAHLEEGNMLYVNNTIQNIYRYFLRNDYKSEFETTLIKVFKKLSEIQDYTAHVKEIKKLKQELEQSGKDAANNQHLALLPVLQSFIDAKMQGLKMHQFAAKQKAALNT